MERRFALGAILIFGSLQQGCTTKYMLTSLPAGESRALRCSYEDLKQKTDGFIVTIHLIDGANATGYIVSANPDSVGWRDPTTKAVSSVASSYINYIECSAGDSGLQGFTVGFLSSTLPILMTGAWNHTEEEGMERSITYPYRPLIPPFILTCSLLGWLAGSYTPHDYVFQVKPDLPDNTGHIRKSP